MSKNRLNKLKHPRLYGNIFCPLCRPPVVCQPKFRSSSHSKLCGIGLALVSQKSSSHHASNPIITFGLRVNSREPNYQDAKNHHYSGDEMVISHHHANGPLPGFVWRRPAAVFLFPVALLLRALPSDLQF